MPTEREFQIAPIVPESVMHNTKVNIPVHAFQSSNCNLHHQHYLRACNQRAIQGDPSTGLSATTVPFMDPGRMLRKQRAAMCSILAGLIASFLHSLYLSAMANPDANSSHVLFSQALSNLQNLTASIFGAAAGILGLESYSGFLFYLILTLLTTALFYGIRVAPTSLKTGHTMFDTSRYFRSQYEFWTGGLFGGLAGYILTWTLFYGLVRA